MRELPWNFEIGLSFESPIAPSQPKWYQVPYMTITHGVDFLRYQGNGHTVGLQWWYVAQSSPLLAWHFDKLTIVSSSFFVAHAGTISLSKDAYHGMKVAVKKANLIPPLETCNQTCNCTFHHVSKAKSLSSAATHASWIFLMISASSSANNISTNSSINCLVFGLISKSRV